MDCRDCSTHTVTASLMYACSTHTVITRLMYALVCRYDGTVRRSGGDVVQFLYGEDGMDGVRVEGQSLEHLKYDEAKLKRTFAYDNLHVNPDWLTAQQAEQLRTDIAAR